MSRVADKIVLITAAAGGQGAGEAVALAREGATLIATDLTAPESDPGARVQRPHHDRTHRSARRRAVGLPRHGRSSSTCSSARSPRGSIRPASAPRFLSAPSSGHGLIGDVPRILSLIAEAANRTGVPVMVHTNAQARSGLDALRSLTGAGVDPHRIVIAHAGDSNDLEYLRAIADTGACLGFDRFGIDHFNPTADRIRTLIALLDAGYADRIHLSHDAACFYDFMVGNPFFADENPDYLFISNEVLPALRDRGVTQETIDQMMITNPRTLLRT